MGQWLARCPLALLAYDPEHYRQRSSGMLWQWAASRAASGLAAAGVGYDTGWLATEAAALGLRWHSPAGQAWLEALGVCRTFSQTKPPHFPLLAGVLSAALSLGAERP